VLLLLPFVALADDAPVERPPEEPTEVTRPTEDDGWIVVPAPDAPLPSAFDRIDAPSEVVGEKAASPWRGANWVRPTLALWRVPAASGHDLPFALGLSGGRRFWRLRDGFRPMADVGLRADFPVAGGKGSWDLGASGAFGYGYGPVGVSVGGELGGSQRAFAGGAQGPALVVGPTAALNLDLWIVQGFIELWPGWALAGDRAGGMGPGDELTGRVGGRVLLGPLAISVDLQRAWSALGPVDRYGFGFGIEL
jgi:hypothetical protein